MDMTDFIKEEGHILLGIVGILVIAFLLAFFPWGSDENPKVWDKEKRGWKSDNDNDVEE